ncbi:SIMPL domain-containing protein [Maribacter sp. 2304DJ31-5]|uniref:SIMPL domain-containing protein n=1 Tax=Maribacter sp. 2304DJ31-5 TaxID=3386273 RepID=UPI0039BD3350
MKNKILLLTTTLLLLSGAVFSQEKFIEVMVKDTITLKPISYEFEVSSGLKFRYDYENPNSESEFSGKLRKEEDRITDNLKKWGYEFRLSGNPEASFTMDPTDKRNFIVKIKDSIQKEEFKNRMKTEGINFYMSNIKYEDRESKTEEIYKRLLRKARERAELIAELSGKKVGDIIEISESKSEFSIISSFIENFAYSRSYGGSSTSFKFNAGVLEKSILVKYEAE